MQTHDLTQGSPEWLAYRREHFNASDAPAMLSCSPYKRREQLLRERATGISEEVDEATQRRFDAGHRFEAQARALAEELLGEDLFPVVGSEGRCSASLDGLTMLGEICWEHKTLNAQLREAFADIRTIAPEHRERSGGKSLPLHYRVQLEQQLMVSGAGKCLFTASRWADDGTLLEVEHCWYYPDPELRARIVAGWKQFACDVAAYVPADAAAPVVAAPVESLPAVVVQVDGVLAVRGNLPAFGDALRAFIARMPTRPETDQEFADADAACKRLKEAEQALDTAEAGALAQISDVEQLRRTVADLKALARATRLATEKLVAAEKDARREALVRHAAVALAEHVRQANVQLHVHGAGQLGTPAPAALAACIKGLKSLDSMRDKLAAELVAQKVAIDAQAQRMLDNRAALRRHDGDWVFLFADFAAVGGKAPEDFAALAELRITRHQQDETARQRTEAAARELAQAQSDVRAKPEPVPANQATAAINAVADTGSRMTLGQINARLLPISVSVAGLAELGFEPVAAVKAARLYREADFPAMCRAVAEHVLAAARPLEVAA